MPRRLRAASIGVVVTALFVLPLFAHRAAIISSSRPASTLDAQVVDVVALAHRRLLQTSRMLPAHAFPEYVDGNGRWRTTGSGGWTSGFLPASLWLSYEQTLDLASKSAAAARLQPLVAQKGNKGTHDLGFMLNTSFGSAYRLTGSDTYRRVLIAAAASLATRYSPIVGAIRAWNDPRDFLVIVDTMTNAELLLWAANHGGDAAWRTMAINHGLTTARVLVRGDGSVIHQARYNQATGALRQVTNASTGLADTATWARGAVWAMHGFTDLYAGTRDVRFLSVARSLADHFVAHVPKGEVSGAWLEASAGKSQPDTSATAVAAAALARLATLDPDAARRAAYAAATRRFLTTLTSPKFLDTMNGTAVLRHGQAGSLDTDTSWGDYYLLEAIERQRLVPSVWPALPVTLATASGDDGHVPTNAIDGNPSTRWSAYGAGQWLRLDLGIPRRVHAVSILWHASAARSARFRIESWTRVRGWVPVMKAASTAWTEGEETYPFSPRDAAAVRIIGLGNTQNAWVSISEAHVR